MISIWVKRELLESNVEKNNEPLEPDFVPDGCIAYCSFTKEQLFKAWKKIKKEERWKRLRTFLRF